MSKGNDLSVKQRAFADSFIETGNATQAAIQAGYSPKYAAQNTNKLLKNTKVSAYIEARMEELKSERIADQTEILESLTAVLRGQKTGITLIGVGKGAQDVIEVEPTVTEKLKAAELLGKRYAMWTDKQQIEAAQQVVITNDLDD